jgi:hypothetical protein
MLILWISNLTLSSSKEEEEEEDVYFCGRFCDTISTIMGDVSRTPFFFRFTSCGWWVVVGGGCGGGVLCRYLSVLVVGPVCDVDRWMG